MKRMIGLILSITMLLSLTACSAEPEAPETEAPTAVTDAPTEEATEPPTEVPNVITPLGMEESVLVDDENCTFSVHFASESEYVGMTLDAVCTNKTDRTLMFTWNTVSVCGYLYDPLWAEEVAPGESVNSTVYIDTFQLEQYGITSVDEIEFTLYIFDSADFMAEPFVNEVFTIYPTGLSADTYVRPERVSAEGEQVIADNGDLTFIIESAQWDGDAYTLRCYLRNRTNTALMYAWEDVAVDGCAIDPVWAVEVPAGKQAYSDITFYRSQLSKNGIEEPEQIDFRLTVTNLEDWEADAILDETFTFRPEDCAVG